MPNWCSTKMTVTGSKEECERFRNSLLVEHVEEDVYDYHKRPIEKIGTRTVEQLKILQGLIPCPQELYDVTHPVREEQAELAKKMLEKYGTTDWYSWQYENWGTKWGDCHTVFDDEDTNNDGDCVIGYSFDTPWGTATKAFLKISSMFPTLRFDFYHDEEAGFFQGCEVMKNGKLAYEKFFEPCNYEVEAPDYDDSDAWDKWNEKYEEWREVQQYEIDQEVDALVI
jgi:hypothetical protein